MTRPSRPPRQPRDTRPPRTGVAEKEVLLGFLDYLRGCVIGKVSDVPEPAVRTPAVASGTNLLGLLNHLTHVERYTFLGDHISDWPSTFHAHDEQTVSSVIRTYGDAVAQANRVIAACDDLESPVPRHPKGRNAPSMRWALVHMIEETGRHAGHLDIIRELTDGTTGR